MLEVMSLIFMNGACVRILNNNCILEIFIDFSTITIFRHTFPKLRNNKTRIIDKPLLPIGICVYSIMSKEAFNITDIHVNSCLGLTLSMIFRVFFSFLEGINAATMTAGCMSGLNWGLNWWLCWLLCT